MSRESLYGKAEAIRATALEQYTVAEVLKVIREHGRETDVDLVSGGLTELAFSEQELAEAKADFAAAQAAGVDVSRVKWLSKEEVQEVSTFSGPVRGWSDNFDSNTARRTLAYAYPATTCGL